MHSCMRAYLHTYLPAYLHTCIFAYLHIWIRIRIKFCKDWKTEFDFVRFHHDHLDLSLSMESILIHKVLWDQDQLESIRTQRDHSGSDSNVDQTFRVVDIIYPFGPEVDVRSWINWRITWGGAQQLSDTSTTRWGMNQN